MSASLDKQAVAYFIFSVGASGCVAFFGQHLIHGNHDAVNLIATIFSVLAGLLIGIITLLADPAILPGRTWRGAFRGQQVLKRRLNRHRLLFLVYLATLTLILAGTLIKNDYKDALPWFERAYLFLATVGILYSFRLPWSLARIQEERLESVVRDKRKEAGLTDGGNKG